MNLASCDLIRHELVLLKHAPHGGCALVTAAPSLDLGGLLLGLADLPLNGLLTDDQHLLVLHHVVAAVLQLRLQVVFDLGLGLFLGVLILEVERGRNLVRQVKLEVNLVETRLEHAVSDGEHLVLLVEEGLGALALLSLVHYASFIAIMFRLGVMADERALLTALKLDLDVSGGNWGMNLQEHLSGDGVARLVEGALRLKLDVASIELAAFVREKEHR